MAACAGSSCFVFASLFVLAVFCSLLIVSPDLFPVVAPVLLLHLAVLASAFLCCSWPWALDFAVACVLILLAFHLAFVFVVCWFAFGFACVVLVCFFLLCFPLAGFAVVCLDLLAPVLACAAQLGLIRGPPRTLL